MLRRGNESSGSQPAERGRVPPPPRARAGARLGARPAQPMGAALGPSPAPGGAGAGPQPGRIVSDVPRPGPESPGPAGPRGPRRSPEGSQLLSAGATYARGALAPARSRAHPCHCLPARQGAALPAGERPRLAERSAGVRAFVPGREGPRARGLTLLVGSMAALRRRLSLHWVHGRAALCGSLSGFGLETPSATRLASLCLAS